MGDDNENAQTQKADQAPVPEGQSDVVGSNGGPALPEPVNMEPPPPPPTPPPSHQSGADTYPFVVACAALIKHLNGQPKIGALDWLWQEARREYKELVGNDEAIR